MPLKYQTRSKESPLRNKTVLTFLAILLLTAGVVSALEITGVIHLFRHKPAGLATQDPTPNRTGGVETKGDNSTSAKGGTDSGSRPEDNKSQTGGTDTNAELKTPVGNFVSNHHPNLSGSPSPDAEQSNCVTTSGATCTIVFTNGSITKQLPVQNTDREGAAYWSWKLSDIGLTAGTWKVQAKAVLGSQTKTASDALDLEIKP